MALSPAERQRARRARQKAGEALPCCSVCGAQLQLNRRERADRQGLQLCWRCWITTTAEGRAAEAQRKRRHVEADPERRRRQVREAAARRRERERQTRNPEGLP